MYVQTTYVKAAVFLFFMVAAFSFSGINKVYAQDEASGEDKVYFMADKMPEFSSSDLSLQEYIRENLRYPVTARRKGITGTVFVKFVVNSKGKVEKVEVSRGVNPALDKAAREVIKNMPDWTPGEKDGKPVAVSQAVPVNFGQ